MILTHSTSELFYCSPYFHVKIKLYIRSKNTNLKQMYIVEGVWVFLHNQILAKTIFGYIGYLHYYFWISGYRCTHNTFINVQNFQKVVSLNKNTHINDDFRSFEYFDCTHLACSAHVCRLPWLPGNPPSPWQPRPVRGQAR